MAAMQLYVQDHSVPARVGCESVFAKAMDRCQDSDVVGLAFQEKDAAERAMHTGYPKQSPFEHPAQQAPHGSLSSGRDQRVPALQRDGSCALPETPQPGKPLPVIRTRTCDSDMSVATPVAAQEQQQAEHDCSQPCAGWFFNCRGCGCMTAYEQSFAGVEVPFCRRCQVLLIEAKPPMQKKMVDTLLYVHHAWTKAGL